MPSRSSGQRTVVLAASAVFLCVLIRTAWMSDDAFITLRTIDNFVNGHGLRWNVAERVQTFTHPAWLFLLTPFYALTREPYVTPLVIQMALALTTLGLTCWSVARSTGQALIAASIFVSSKALVDFSTSGLENALTHLLLVLFFLAWARKPADARSAGAMAALGALLLLCRQDLALLIAPAVAHAFVSQPRGRWRALLLGAVPLLGWEAFSFVYYGAFVPNTALAKLATGIPFGDLARQGGRYWIATGLIDPVTPLVLLGLTTALAIENATKARLMALGIAAYALYLVSVGGDFMSGRFFTPLLVWAVLGFCGLEGTRLRMPGRALGATALGVVIAGLFVPHGGPLLNGLSFGKDSAADTEFGHFGVADERRFYYQTTGLLRRIGYGGPREINSWEQGGVEVRLRGGALRVMQASNVGLFGYFAGPRLHIVDRNALCDPLLARLPADHPWRIGHFTRRIPDGYMETWQTGANRLTDPGLRDFYAQIREVTQGPLLSSQRLGLAAKFALGAGAHVRP